jgi:hypothetical protein
VARQHPLCPGRPIAKQRRRDIAFLGRSDHHRAPDAPPGTIKTCDPGRHGEHRRARWGITFQPDGQLWSGRVSCSEASRRRGSYPNKEMERLIHRNSHFTRRRASGLRVYPPFIWQLSGRHSGSWFAAGSFPALVSPRRSLPPPSVGACGWLLREPWSAAHGSERSPCRLRQLPGKPQVSKMGENSPRCVLARSLTRIHGPLTTNTPEDEYP